jgi:hypothetical protein
MLHWKPLEDRHRTLLHTGTVASKKHMSTACLCAHLLTWRGATSAPRAPGWSASCPLPAHPHPGRPCLLLLLLRLRLPAVLLPLLARR